MRISDWSSDVCSSDLPSRPRRHDQLTPGSTARTAVGSEGGAAVTSDSCKSWHSPIDGERHCLAWVQPDGARTADHRHRAARVGEEHAVARAGGEDRLAAHPPRPPLLERSEEHTSELQSLMRISYAVFCLQKKNRH